MKNLCLIPARSGSKRIPNKNMRNFAGKKIIEYSLDVAMECRLFDRIVISSDSDKIGMLGAIRGATYLKRSADNSSDEARLYDVCKEVLTHIKEDFDNLLILYACAPFTTVQQVYDGFKLLTDKPDADTVFPVTDAGYYERLMKKDTDGRLDILFPEFTEKPSQEMTPLYQHVGAWFWCKVAALMINNTILPEQGCYGIYATPWEGYELDTESDWYMAEKLYEATH